MPYVFSCLTCFAPYLLSCLTWFMPCVLLRLTYLNVLSCLTCFVPYMLFCLKCLVSYMLLYLTCLVLYGPSSLSNLVVPCLLLDLTCLFPTCSRTSRALVPHMPCALCSLVPHSLGALGLSCLNNFSSLMPNILPCISCLVVLVSHTSLLRFGYFSCLRFSSSLDYN